MGHTGNGGTGKQGGRALDAELIRDLIVICLDGHDDVRVARSVETLYRDRFACIVFDGRRQAYTVHVLRDPRPFRRATTVPTVTPLGRRGA